VSLGEKGQKKKKGPEKERNPPQKANRKHRKGERYPGAEVGATDGLMGFPFTISKKTKRYERGGGPQKKEKRGEKKVNKHGNV